jgi:hypothetical protein
MASTTRPSPSPSEPRSGSFTHAFASMTYPLSETRSNESTAIPCGTRAAFSVTAPNVCDDCALRVRSEGCRVVLDGVRRPCLDLVAEASVLLSKDVRIRAHHRERMSTVRFAKLFVDPSVSCE